MTRTYYPPTRGPNGDVGHWVGMMEKGEYVDIWVPHCRVHQDHERKDCARCAEEASRAPQA